MGWRGFAISAAALIALSNPASATPPNIVTDAVFEDPTTRYDHGILGDAIEWGTLRLTVDMCHGCEIAHIREFVMRLPENRVFEDLTPRLVPLTGETGSAVMVVETDLQLGARLALYDESGLVAAAPFIGRTHRWLAPIGAGDLNGDGDINYAYVDRPHLAKTIRVWRYEKGDKALKLVAELPGYTNHRIGEDHITGGIRDCGQGPEMIVVDSNWQNIAAVILTGAKLTARTLGPFSGPGSIRQALGCS